MRRSEPQRPRRALFQIATTIGCEVFCRLSRHRHRTSFTIARISRSSEWPPAAMIYNKDELQFSLRP
jgi:hypothetical protein